MASVIKRRKSPYWVACYSLPDGTRLQRSTKTKDKGLALQIAHTAEQAARKKITADAARGIISDIVQRIHGEDLDHNTCEEYFTAWIERRKTEIAYGSLDRFERGVREFREFLGSKWNSPLSDLTPSTIAGFRNELAKSYAPSTANLSLKIIKKALKDAWQDGLIPASPAHPVQLLRAKGEILEKKVFTTEQYHVLLEHADDEWKGIIHFGAFTGQRISDIALAEVTAVENGWWRFKSKKTGVTMAIPLATPVQEWLSQYLQNRKVASKYIFHEQASTMLRANGMVSQLSERFRNIMAKAGLATKRERHKPKKGRAAQRERSELSFHSFRHTCTTWLKTQGVGESVAMAFVGHESKAVNRAYTHLPESALEEAVRKIESLARVTAA